MPENFSSSDDRLAAIEAEIAALKTADAATDARLDEVDVHLSQSVSRNKIAVQELRRVVSWVMGAGAIVGLFLSVGDSDRAAISRGVLNQLAPVGAAAISLLLLGPDLLKTVQSRLGGGS